MNEAIFDEPFDLRVFVNTECDCPGGDVPKDNCRIVRIAAVLYDVANGKELADFDERVGSTSEGERDFPDVLATFAVFCARYPVWAFSKDQRILEQNCDYCSIKFPLTQPFIRVKSLLPSWGVDPSEYSCGTLYKAAGLEMDGHAHDALHNARSMAAAVSYFENHELFSRPSA